MHANRSHLLLACLLAGPITLVAHSRAQDTTDPPAFADVCFDDFHLPKHYSSGDQLRKLFKPVRGRIGDYRFHSMQMGQFDGIFRLVPKWTNDSAMRLAIHHPRMLALHFWKGNCGITLSYHRQKQNMWAAYGTTRENAQKQTPKTFALWATDGGRYERALAGTVAVRFQDNQLVLTRGDIVLLCVPFKGLPEEVYLEAQQGKAIGVEMFRCGPVPVPVETPNIVRRVDRPADVEWKTDLWPKSKFEKLPTGEIQVSLDRVQPRDFHQDKKKRRDSNAPVSHAGIPLDPSQLTDVVLELEDVQPYTGVYLANADGRHRYWVTFQNDRRSRQAVIELMPPKDYMGEKTYNSSANHFIPYAGERLWLRIIAAGGLVRFWISGDGRHWSLTTDEESSAHEPMAEVGIFAFPDQHKAQSIRLKSLQIRRLARLESLAPAEVRRRVPELPRGHQQWLEAVESTRPGDVAQPVWRNACVLDSLAKNYPNHIVWELMLESLNDAVEQPGDTIEKLRLLDEASLIARRDVNNRMLAKLYERVGSQLRHDGTESAFIVASQALLSRPSWTSANPFPTDLLWHDLFTMMQTQRWKDVDRLCHRALFWLDRKESQTWRRGADWTYDRTIAVHFVEWAMDHARVALARPADGKLPRLDRRWQHPLVAEIGKESFNILSEFNASLASDAHLDACRILGAVATADDLGLLPDSRDRQLLVSMPQVVRLAMRDHPKLQETMQKRFGPQGKLRVGRAIAANDLAAVNAATIQFLGTEAAAAAHRWLGDRALSSGDFTQAIDHYRHAAQNTTNGSEAQLAARTRLAGAMLGRDVGQPVNESVTFGPATLTPKQFEQLVARSRRDVREEKPREHVNGHAFAPAPPIAQYELRDWATLHVRSDRRVTQDERLWAACSTAVEFADGKMIVNNQLQQVAFELGSKKELWRREASLRKQPHCSFSPLRSVIDGDRIFCRRSADEGFELVCLNLRDGEVRWHSRPVPDKRIYGKDFRGTASVISDPILAGADLVALTATNEPADQCLVGLAAFDPATGRILREAPLVRFRQRWPHGIAAQAVSTGDQLVATVGGAVLGCDLFGRVRWVRRQSWMPPPTDHPNKVPWFQQLHRPPVVADGCVYATQPGVWAIDAVDLASGRLLWHTTLPTLTSLVGKLDTQAGELLIAETSDGLLAVEPHWSSVVWRHNIVDRFETRLCGDSKTLCYTRRDPAGQRNRQSHILLAWLDPATGKLVEETQAKFSREINDPPLGPLVTHNNRHWLFFSPDRNANQQITELQKK